MSLRADLERAPAFFDEFSPKRSCSVAIFAMPFEGLQAYNGRGGSSLQGPASKRTDAATLEDCIGTEDPDLSRADLSADLNRMLRTISPWA